MSVTRRRFLQIGAAGTGVAAASGLTTDWWGYASPQVPNPHTQGDRIVPTFCELCFWKCGVLAHVRGDEVTKLEGNPAHPLSRGRLCPRGVGGTGALNDPDRLKQPLVRMKKRGEDVFAPVSWDDALGRVAQGMEQVKAKYGPEAVALFSHGYGGSWFSHLMKAFGSHHIAAPSYAQCRGPREVGYNLTYGTILGSPEPVDIANARCITLIGSHLGENMHNTQVQDFAEALDRGAQLVVVDPRFSVAAGKAKYWLPIKPGTDIALLLAWMHVIVTEKLYDADYLTKYAIGFDALAAHVADKTPEWAYPHTGIRPELIRETARFIAGFKPASLVHPGRRATWYGDDTQRARAMAILAALLGNWGRRGGFLSPGQVEVAKYPYPKYPEHSALRDKPEGKYPLADEVLASGVCNATVGPDKLDGIHAWLVYGTNLIQALPDWRQTDKKIQALDFLAVVDVLPAEIVGYADVVLPECTYLERDDDLWAPAWNPPFVALRQKVVEPKYDSKPGWWIAKELGKKLKLDAYFPWQTGAQVVDTRLTASGMDPALVRKSGVAVGKLRPSCEEDGLPLTFDTPSGKIELASETLKSHGFHALPEFTPPDEPPAGSFRLLTGRSPVHTFGRTTNNRELTEIQAENQVWLNAAVAKTLPGFESEPLQQGEYVVLINQDGIKSSPVSVKITERIRGDAVYLQHGFGHTAKGLKFARGKGASDSHLTTLVAIDPIMGGTGMSVNFVRLERPGVA